MLIDTHCHLYLEEFRTDIEAVMARAAAESVQQFFLPAISSEETTALLELERKFPGQCKAMMGLHPCSIKENYKKELELVESWLEKRPFAAIGEIGLDFYWDVTYKEQQYEAFRQQLEWSIQYKRPVVIHTRQAMKETLEVVREYQPAGVHGIFHCFGGSYEEAAAIRELGFYLGIGGVVTYKKAGLAEALEQIPLEWLVLETDAPYLTPVPFRGKRNESSYLKYIVQKIAEVKNITIDEVAAVTTRNAEKIFGS